MASQHVRVRPWCMVLPGLLLLAGRLAAADQALPLYSAPLRLAGNLVFLPAAVGKAFGLQMILDTGATESVLTPPAAERAGLVVHVGAGDVRRARAARLSVGNAAADDFPLAIFDPPQARPLRLTQGIDYQGLLGATFLQRFTVVIDYPGARVALLPPRALPEGADGNLPFSRLEGLVIVEAQVGTAAVPARMLLDTGAAETLIFPPLAARVGLTAPRPGTPPRRQVLSRLQVGAAVCEHTVVVVDRQGADRIVRRCDGILGYPFLSAFRLTLDYAAGRLRLELPPDAPSTNAPAGFQSRTANSVERSR